MNHLFVPHPLRAPLGYQIDCCGIAVPMFKLPLFYLITGPKHKSSDALNLDMQKRSCKVLTLSEKVCMDRGKKKLYIGFSNIHGFRHPLGVLECIPH